MTTHHHYNRATVLDLLSAANDAIGTAMQAINADDLERATRYTKHGALFMQQAADLLGNVAPAQV